MAITAEAAMRDAVKSAGRRMWLDSFQIVECLRAGNLINAQCDLNYDFSKHIAAQLGYLNEEVKAVYIDEFDIVPEDHFFGETARSTVVFLFVLVQNKNCDLMSSLVKQFDRALVQWFYEIIGKPRLLHLLEVRVLDDEDANNTDGYRAWISSDHFFCTEVWKREELKWDINDHNERSCFYGH